METPEHIKQLDDYDLNEALDKKLDILQLCADGVMRHCEGCLAIQWAVLDALELVEEVQLRLNKLSE